MNVQLIGFTTASGNTCLTPADTQLGDWVIASVFVPSTVSPPSGYDPPSLFGILQAQTVLNDPDNPSDRLFWHMVYESVLIDGEQLIDFTDANAVFAPLTGTPRVIIAVVRPLHESEFFWDETYSLIHAAATDTHSPEKPSTDDGHRSLVFIHSYTPVTATSPSGWAERYDSGGDQFYDILDSAFFDRDGTTIDFDLSTNASSSAYVLNVKGPDGADPITAGFRNYCKNVNLELA